MNDAFFSGPRAPCRAGGTWVPAGGETVRAFVPAPPPRPALRWDAQLQDLLGTRQPRRGTLDGAATLLPEADVFLCSYIRKEAVLSSQIEGTQSSPGPNFFYERRFARGPVGRRAGGVALYVAPWTTGSNAWGGISTVVAADARDARHFAQAAPRADKAPGSSAGRKTGSAEAGRATPLTCPAAARGAPRHVGLGKNSSTTNRGGCRMFLKGRAGPRAVRKVSTLFWTATADWAGC